MNRSFMKREREKAKREKAALKRERRITRLEEQAEEAPAGPALSQDEVLSALDALHLEFEDGKVPFEEFETTRAELLARLAP